MEAQHTPGPWKQANTFVYALNDRGFNRFTCIVQDAHTPLEELEANARLIAAAPDLLEALQNLENDDGSIPYHAWALVQAAISKATGGAP